MDMDGMDMGNPPPAAMAGMDMNMDSMKYAHMTLYWGKNSLVLFDGFPGSNTGHYILALVIVFVLSAGLEFLSHCCLIGPRWQHTVAELSRTALHMVRMGLYYLVMLALMSFNVGVLLVAILGHAVIFLGHTEGWTSAVASLSHH
ncbi:Copper transporter [Rhynchospora pubera]|uniref:Copper transport protein n=1 Tax=Rhynchospora pubera TaxID=906938 RepID=A0AAV8H234_9POAL|nr:Copper transporter [Rhynchospora pubera]KAJ4809333.1 Copper transporter [Rhynchospora pubera]